MPPKAGSSLYGTDGSTYRLSGEIGKGAEGAVCTIEGHPDHVAKLYHNGVPPAQIQKLEAMCSLRSEALTKVSAWPTGMVSATRSGQPQGILMRRISGHYSINQLYAIKSRLKTFPEAQFPFLLHVAANIARAFATVHEAGQVIGDVNHSNLLVSPNGTVALIDCDSFQVRSGEDIFVCNVGVPEFTPPELQGLSFASHRRSADHDAFGLAVLIFYLLFMGRHPFMGAYDPKLDDMVSLDAAIASFKFPYALSDQSPEVRLPPFVPRLTDYPIKLRGMFTQAFTREYLLRGRPTAQQWVETLVEVAPALRQCKSNQTHHNFGTRDCPWCRLEGIIGSAIFGIKILTIHDEQFNLLAIWKLIDDIWATPELLVRPDVAALRSQYSPDPSIPEIIKKRRIFRICSLLTVIVTSALALEVFSPLLSFIAVAISLIVAVSLWRKASATAKNFEEAYTEAVESYKSAETAFDLSADVPQPFRADKERLRAAKVEYEALPGLRSQRLRALDLARELKQRQHYLEGFRLEDERIPNMGDKTKMILYTWGILDAWDVDAKKIGQIKGFGPVRTKTLVDWRASKERNFRFDPSQQIDPRDLNALESEFRQKASALISKLVAGPSLLRQHIAVWHANRRQLSANLLSSAHKLASAEVNREKLRVF
jgi:DNA-binding helix-hairpin-helix protein with protein kinase domain